MLGNFTYCNPTKLYFGKDALENLHGELQKYGKKIVLVYGGGSIKKNGIYDDVVKILQDEGKDVAEIAGVMPNPTIHKLREGIDIARKHGVDLILAVGGGSVIDYAKPWPSPYTATKIRGINISSASKNRAVTSSLSAMS